jgi:hypothetical protein
MTTTATASPGGRRATAILTTKKEEKKRKEKRKMRVGSRAIYIAYVPCLSVSPRPGVVSTPSQ